MLKISDAYSNFNEKALALEMVKSLPPTIEALGSVFSAITAPLGNIDKLVVVDSGGNGGNGDSGALNRLAKTGPVVLFQLLEQMKANGFDISGVLKKVGVEMTDAEITGDSDKS